MKNGDIFPKTKKDLVVLSRLCCLFCTCFVDMTIKRHSNLAITAVVLPLEGPEDELLAECPLWRLPVLILYVFHDSAENRDFHDTIQIPL